MGGFPEEERMMIGTPVRYDNPDCRVIVSIAGAAVVVVVIVVVIIIIIQVLGGARKQDVKQKKTIQADDMAVLAALAAAHDTAY